MMKIGRLLFSPLGRIVLSILLGLGLSTVFKQSCSGQSCITYHGPILGQIEGKTYKFGEKCYVYDIAPIKCNSIRQTVEFSNEHEDPGAMLAAPHPDQAQSWLVNFHFPMWDTKTAMPYDQPQTTAPPSGSGSSTATATTPVPVKTSTA
jgi:hypothetical protein